MSTEARLGRILNAFAGVLAAFVVLTLAIAVYLTSLSSTLPDVSAREEFVTPETTLVYAADGSVIAKWHGEQDRTAVPLSGMPVHLRNAVVAIEDRRFYQHNGVDTEAIVRALSVNAGSGDLRQGGSTITQQLVKILFTDGERTLTRKIKEALLAYELEARTDKGKVLETYLNTVYFGHGAYGVESAARRYFNKGAASLDVAQSALLAGIIQSPSGYDPVANPKEALDRRNLVLYQMREQGMLGDAEYRKALARPIKLSPPKNEALFAPHFVEYVKRDLIARLGAKKVFEGGLRVYTTLNPKLQKLAENSSRQLSRKDDPEVAVVAIRHTDGHVLAMVGGRDFSRNQFNLASQGLRQPGSAFKMFVLATALEKGIRPQRVISAGPYTVPVKDGVWRVKNYENSRTSGSMTLQAATNWSVNAVYARLIMTVGPERVAEMAKRLGIVTKVDANPAIALGGLTRGVSPLEMASAYGTVANGGTHYRPTGIVRVTDEAGKTVYEPRWKPRRAISRSVAVQTSLMLHEVVEHGTGRAARIGTWAAGKTGTTQSYRDAWFVGWAGDISTAVWVGHPEAQVSMTNVHGIKVTGGSFPAKIWAQFMHSAVSAQSRPVTPSSQQEGTAQVLVSICQDSMQLANQRCPNRVDVYLSPSMIPKSTCRIH